MGAIVVERKYFTCPSRESNPGRWIYRQTLYHVAVKAGFYRKAVEVYYIPSPVTSVIIFQTNQNNVSPQRGLYCYFRANCLTYFWLTSVHERIQYNNSLYRSAFVYYDRKLYFYNSTFTMCTNRHSQIKYA